MDFLASFLGGPASAVLGGLGGALVRFATEWQAQKSKAQENAHELALLDKQASMEQARADRAIKELSAASEAQLAAIRAQGSADLDLADARMLEAAAVAQTTTRSGVLWIDALNASVRPVSFYLLLLGYEATKCIAFAVALIAGADAMEVVRILWTDFDRALLASAFGFWFVDRRLRAA